MLEGLEDLYLCIVSFCARPNIHRQSSMSRNR